MSRAKLKIDYYELTDKGQHLRLTFNRPLSALEAKGLVLIIQEQTNGPR